MLFDDEEEGEAAGEAAPSVQQGGAAVLEGASQARTSPQLGRPASLPSKNAVKLEEAGHEAHDNADAEDAFYASLDTDALARESQLQRAQSVASAQL